MKRMKPRRFAGLAVSIVADLAVLTGARAGSDAPADLELAFQNTLLSTYPDGRQAKLWLDPDGTYTAESRRHRPLRGSWRIEDDRLCLRQTHPPLLLPFTYCTPLHEGGIGTSWQATAPTGEAITVTLVAGR